MFRSYYISTNLRSHLSSNWKLVASNLVKKLRKLVEMPLFGLAFLLYLFKLSAENVFFNLLALGKTQWENKEHTHKQSQHSNQGYR